MKAQTVDVREAAGRVLCSTIFKAGGRKLLSKGHVMSIDDIQLLSYEGMNEVSVSQLEEGEIGEDDAVAQVASAMACGCAEIRMAAGGRANIVATEECCVLVDDDLLKQLNRTGSIVIATSNNFGYAHAGQRIATIKSAPFAVAAAQLEAVLSVLQAQGPILQARPVRNGTVAVLYTDPSSGERAQQLFEGIMRQRLEKFAISARYVLACDEEEGAVSQALDHLMRAKPACILIASTTAPAGPDDVIGRAMARVGCQIERFLAPVEPGNLLLLGYSGDVPVVSAPGCFRSAKPNVVDLLLPPMLSRYRISGWELASLGHGGLLA
jgi:molybdenum cofactor cytidylyltransferase